MKEAIRRLYKPFILIFLVSLLIINWHDISFIFNYRVISSQLSNLFEKIKPARAELTNNDYFTKENFIEIPKIGIKAPIIFAKNDDEDFQKALKNGVLLYPVSALPGEPGTTIILGHSAPIGWPKINYDWVFNDLNELTKEDEFYIYFNYQRYSYKVIEKLFLAPGEEIPDTRLTNEKSMVVLLSCWPPGKDRERIVVRAKLVI